MNEQKVKILLSFAALFLLSAFVFGLSWLLSSPWEIIGIVFAFASGLSMIILPCTLPAVLVIVPLVLGKERKKGVAMALLFALGLMMTLAAYSLLVAFFGKVFYLDRITFLMWLIAGSAAYLFGLYELGVLSLRFPHLNFPRLPKLGDYGRSFVFGLLLGNAGIGCPNPAFYVLLTYIASSASLITGGILGLVHGFGRIVPLLAIVFLAMLGLNVSSRLTVVRQKLQPIVGWALIVFALLLLPKPLFGHVWWESSIFHEGWQRGVMAVFGERIAESREAEEILASQNVIKPFLASLVPTHELQIYVPWIFIGILASATLFLVRKKKGKSTRGSLGYAALIFAIVAFLARLAELIPHTH